VTIKLSINSKSCTTFTTDVQNVRRLQRHKLQERVYKEKVRTVEELQQRITEWQRLDQRVIDNAVKQWCKRVHACVAANGRHGLCPWTVPGYRHPPPTTSGSAQYLCPILKPAAPNQSLESTHEYSRICAAEFCGKSRTLCVCRMFFRSGSRTVA